MKRFLIALVLICAVSVSVLAGEIPSVPGPVAPPFGATQSSRRHPVPGRRAARGSDCVGCARLRGRSVGAVVNGGVRRAAHVRRQHSPPARRSLSDDARTVLFAAAVLGRRFEWDLLPAITGLEESAVATGLHRAVNSQLVAVDAGAFRFRHALSRDAVLGSLLPPDHAAIAGRALEAIERAHPGLPGEWCELAAEIADAANAHGRAAGLLLEAGRRAMRRGALATAERTLDRAAAVAREDGPAIIDIEETLTEVLSLAGKCDRAMEVGASLLVHVGHSPDRAGQRAQAQLRLARAAVAATRGTTRSRGSTERQSTRRTSPTRRSVHASTRFALRLRSSAILRVRWHSPNARSRPPNGSTSPTSRVKPSRSKVASSDAVTSSRLPTPSPAPMPSPTQTTSRCGAFEPCTSWGLLTCSTVAT